MLNSVIFKNCRLPRYLEKSISSAVQVQIEPSTSKQKRKKKAVKESESKNAEWEKYTVNWLNKEYEYKQKLFKHQASKREAQTSAISYIRNDDVRQLFGLSSAVVQTVRRNPNAEISPEFFSIILKYTTILFEGDFSARTPDEWKAIIYGAINFLTRVPLNNDLTTMGFANALRSLQYFLDQFSNELCLVDLGTEIMVCKNKLDSVVASRKGISLNQMIFDPADYDNLALMTAQGFQEVSKKHSPDALGYDKNIKLVSDLLVKKISSNYTSPFIIPQRTKEDYVKMFKNQLHSELGGYLKVKNFARKSTLEPMETVIESLRWKECIEANLKIWSMKVKAPLLKSALSGLDYSGCAEALLDVVKCYLSQGQKLFVVAEFESALSTAVLNFCYKSFLEKIEVSADKVISGVFDSFAEYFTDNTIPQKYTLREWWMHCCQMSNVDPEISLPLTDFRFFLKPRIGGLLANMVMSSCKICENDRLSNAFFYQKVMQEEETNLMEKKVDINKMIRIHPKIMSKIETHEFEYMLFPHEYLPLQVPPRPWIDAGKNGPFFTRPSNIIRILPEYEDIDVNKEFRDRLENNSTARPVIDALNDLGTTPWIINGKMLNVLTEVFTMCTDLTKEELLSTLSIPLHSSTMIIPEYYESFGNVNVAEITTEEWREYYKKKSSAIKKKNELNSLWCWLHYRISLAKHYRNDVLFFPHNMDFRGRVYPISPHLNHMGDDINRCILKFAKGKPLGERGLYWLKLHVVNITGLLKKKSILERIQYAEDHLDDILDSANNPLNGRKWWLKSEEPWQTLAACMELRDAIESGDPINFISHLPIHQDGSCNGLQHYAALGRDHEGALEVNLLPCDIPADVYSSVANRVEQRRIEDEQNSDSPNHEIAKRFRKFLPDVLPRKVIKQTVMTTVYGVTDFGARQQIKRQLKVYAKSDTDPIEIGRYASYLTSQTFGSLHDAFTTSMEIKEWFRKSATSICQLMKSVEWSTPLGLPVMQPYLNTQSKFQKVCKIPVRHKQVNAFPPNYVHSLDSTHMMLTTLHCHQRGITFAAVHDCFWTHACTVDEMNEICREQFVRMHSEPLIERLAKDMRKKYLPKELLDKMDMDEKKKLEERLTPNFETGKLDITKVKDSVYFFS